jgi:hypothetical protein
MLEHLTSWAGEAARWAPLVPIIPIVVVALVQAVVLPARFWAKGIWALMVIGCGIACGAIALTLSLRHDQALQAELGRVSQAELGAQLAQLKGLWAQWDAISHTLPPAGEAPAAAFDSVSDALASLSARVASVDAQIAARIAALKEQTKGRSIGDDAAAKLIDYLRQYGGNRVVVSCVPNDLEAYTYANQLVTILTMAGWDARGPEVTAASDDAVAMGVSLYVRDPRTAEAAKILIDAFTRFNVPYQTGLTASNAIPDLATVELFVAKKP